MQRGIVALLLFGSGACALIYQTAWLREFRLVFGASTAATSAVVAIFMGGLGFGGLLLGRRADRSSNPLQFYGNLELLVATSAALTPLLVLLVRWIYIVSGGSIVMGQTLATIVRVILAGLVLAVPTLLMGGTLPAAARAVERERDVSRRELALIYGTNTVGAVVGTLLSTFVLLELFGTRKTLWIAALVNALIGVAARIISRRAEYTIAPDTEEKSRHRAIAPSRNHFVLAAAAVVGFAFLLMELVWYRMLAPLLGGSTFTFGLILALALLGIGLGGVIYAWVERREVTLAHLAVTCALEAFFVVLPLALGDRVAVLALLLRPVGVAGFAGLVFGWVIVASLVVIPPALIAGFQFPLLIALLGKGREEVGKHVGLAYLWNTIGAIAGSLAGGFGFLPLLTAPGAWRLVAALLLLLAAIAIGMGLRSRQGVRQAVMASVLVLLPVPLLFAAGPTAAWRHSGIGAGRAGFFEQTSNGLRDWVHRYRRTTPWEAEGVESSVALSAENGLSFIINGKNDGNARNDAGTQVTSGILGALLHGSVKRAFVIGMGTGSTSGWLGALPGIEEVHTVELEPAVLEVARACTAVNRNVLENPRVKVTIGDAREVLLTDRAEYDLIFSEPSNPYRAGIASLFTREFYRAAKHRLRDGGMFVQWLQAYEVDGATVRTVIGTLGQVFPAVEVWQSKPGDLLLVASTRARVYDTESLRKGISTEPFRSGLFFAWRAADLEGVLARFVAGGDLGSAVAASDQFVVNTDDRNVVEFGFARSVGTAMAFDIGSLRQWAHRHGSGRPRLSVDDVDWQWVEDMRITLMTAEGMIPLLAPEASPDQKRRHAAQVAYINGDLSRTIDEWGRQPRPPRDSVELAVIADALADRGDVRAKLLIAELRKFETCEADAILALLLLRTDDLPGATDSLVRAFVAYRADPWPLVTVMRRALMTAEGIAAQDREGTLSRRLYESMRQPFSVAMLDDERRIRLVKIAARTSTDPCNANAIAALHDLEPYVPWRREFLEVRQACYERVGDPRVGQAARDLAELTAHETRKTLDLR